MRILWRKKGARRNRENGLHGVGDFSTRTNSLTKVARQCSACAPLSLRIPRCHAKLKHIDALCDRGAFMARKTPKSDIVAFKVEEELAAFLNQLPNKSAFIRKAIAAMMSMACPLCNGAGQVSPWTH